MVKDYSLKKVIVENDLDKEFRSIRRKIYLGFGSRDIELLDLAYKEYDCFVGGYGDDVVRVCNNLNHSLYRKKKLVNQRVNYMLNNGRCLFLTFTFTDKSLNKTSRDYRREKVCKWLQLNGSLYVANIDFGVKDEYIDKFGISRKGTHREHYHAILMTDNVVDYTSWNYGALNGIEIYRESSKAIAQYVTKLSNHCLKDSTKVSRVIYSKKWKEVII